METRILIVIDKSIDPAQGSGVSSWAIDLKEELQRQEIWCEIAGVYSANSPFHISGSNQKERTQKLLQIISRHQITAVISGTSKTAFASWAIMPQDVVKIATIHGAKPSIVKRELLAADRVDAYVCVSEPVKSIADSYQPEKPVFVINNGVKLFPATLASNREQKLLWIGRLQIEQKRAHWLRNIVPLANQAGYTVQIIGNGSCKSWLKRKLESAKVEWSEDLSRAQVSELMVKAAGVLFTSNYEGLSIAMLEAMKAGCLVIAPDLAKMKAGVLNHNNSLLYKSSFNSSWDKQTETSIKMVFNKLANSETIVLAENALKTLSEKCDLAQTAKAYVELINKLPPYAIRHPAAGVTSPLSALTNLRYQRYGFCERNWQRLVEWVYQHA